MFFHVASVLSECCNMFHTVCPKCFICFKCVLHSSVHVTECRSLVLVSMRAGRAKPWPPTRGGGIGRHPRCGEEAQGVRCCYEKGKDESSGQPGRNGDATPVWKRRG